MNGTPTHEQAPSAARRSRGRAARFDRDCRRTFPRQGRAFIPGDQKFGFEKTRLRGLVKNYCKIKSISALSNLFQTRRQLHMAG